MTVISNFGLTCLFTHSLLKKAGNRCPPTYRHLQYSGKTKTFTPLNDEDIEIAFRFLSNKIINYEEYLIYDFVGMVGSIGGSLGMFLGFSFLDYMFSFIDFIQEKVGYCKLHKRRLFWTNIEFQHNLVL